MRPKSCNSFDNIDRSVYYPGVPLKFGLCRTNRVAAVKASAGKSMRREVFDMSNLKDKIASLEKKEAHDSCCEGDHSHHSAQELPLSVLKRVSLGAVAV